jgi:threonine synthase
VVDDEDAYRCRDELLQREGIWVEPAGAVSVAGLEVALGEGVVAPGETAVCVLTGHGFKTALGQAAAEAEPALRLELDELERFVREL